jgi:aspartate aminotransferase
MSTTSAISFNPRVAAMQPSATLAMSAKAKELRRSGHPVISLSAGEPDFDTPQAIAEAGIQAIRDGYTRYTQNTGMLELREAIADKLQRDNHLTYDPGQIVCSNGAKQSLALTMNALVRPGDEVLIPAPYWVSYPEMVRMAGGEPVAVPTTVEDGYKLTPDQLEKALTSRTRMLVHCSPSNPTGAVYTQAELEALAEVLQRHPHVFVVSDEIYEYVTYGTDHIAFASLPGMRERTITVNGFSKGFAMTGWRLGYLAAPQAIADAAAKIQSQFTSAPCSISQKAGVTALTMDFAPVRQMVAAFAERRDLVLERLRAIDGVACPQPEGAFYVFPDVSAFHGTTTPGGRAIDSSEALCLYLLEEHYVATVHGEAFGMPSGIRLSYATGTETLTEALDRMTAALGQLS